MPYKVQLNDMTACQSVRVFGSHLHMMTEKLDILLSETSRHSATEEVQS